MAITWEKLVFETNVIVKSIGTAKGVLIGFSAADTPGTLGVGANDEVLTVDDGEVLGVKWSASGGGVAIATVAVLGTL